MAEEQEKRDSKCADNDIVAKINRKNLQKQKELDSQNHEWLQRKKNEELNQKGGNPYRRKECKPVNIVNQSVLESENKVSKEVIKVEETKVKEEEKKEVPLKEQFKTKIDNQKKIVENLNLNCVRLMKIYGIYFKF